MSDSDIGGDTSVVTTSTSWFSRIGNSFVGVLFGILLILGGIVLLFWNESRAVTTERSLAEGRGAVISVDAGAPLAANEGKLIHVAGPVTASAKLADPDFQISVAALTLHRKVEMYQWEEHEESKTEKRLGGGETTTKTYTYTKVWKDGPIASGQFHARAGHENPQFTISARDVVAKDAKLGGFLVSEALLKTLSADQPAPVDDAAAAGLRAKFGRTVRILDGVAFVGDQPDTPRVGDLRIGFTATPAGDFSVVARQAGAGFGGYQTKAGDIIETIRAGRLTPQQIFAELESDNKVLTWILRAVGSVLILIGFSMIFAPLAVLADIIPFLGDIVGFGTFTMALLLTLVVAPVTIAIAWFAFRPLLSLLVIGGTVAAFWAVRRFAPKRAPVPKPA